MEVRSSANTADIRTRITDNSWAPDDPVGICMIGASGTLETDNIVEDADNAPKTTGSYNKSAAPVDLQFSHKLVKLAFSIEVGAGVTESLDGLTVKITGQRFFFSPTNRSYDVGFRVVFFP